MYLGTFKCGYCTHISQLTIFRHVGNYRTVKRHVRVCKLQDLFLLFLQIHWVQQQHEKQRKKRDYAIPTVESPFSQYFSAIAPEASRHGQPRYRAVSRTFPDPLFKEQWYLVSWFSIFPLKINFVFQNLLYSFGKVYARSRVDNRSIANSSTVDRRYLKSKNKVNFKSFNLSFRLKRAHTFQMNSLDLELEIIAIQSDIILNAHANENYLHMLSIIGVGGNEDICIFWFHLPTRCEAAFSQIAI